MSAHMTSEKHVNTLATYAYVEGLTLDPADFATALTVHNVRSLQARYEGCYGDMVDGWREYAYKPVNLSAVKREACTAYRQRLENLSRTVVPKCVNLPTFILKQARCFDYQACEYDGWETSETKRLLDLIVEHCKAQGAVEDGPKYDATPWGVE